MKSEATTLRRRSPLGNLEPRLLNELCELHPWDLGRLSSEAGIDRSVLSHVFAGRRPLPQHAASRLLGLIGLLPSGEIDASHLFVWRAQIATSELLKEWLERLMPDGAEIVEIEATSRLAAEGSGSIDHGWAIFNGQTAALILASPGCNLPVVGQDGWKIIDYTDDQENFLQTEQFPSRDKVVRLVADVPTFERLVMQHPGWESVKRAAVDKGLSVDEVLALINAYKPTKGSDKSLFPLHSARLKNLR